MKVKRILVTGAAGFIGSHLVDQLLREGHQVTGVDNLRNGSTANLSLAFQHDNFVFVKADITDPFKMQQVCKGQEVLYHLACMGVRHSLHAPFENHRVNAEGTLVMLEASRLNNIDKFFYISTSEVYGKALTFPLNEKSGTYPITVYGSSKLAGEHYTNSYFETYGLDTTVLRIFNNYGPRAHYEGDSGEIIPRSIVKMIYKQNPVVFGDGEVTRDFFFVKDTASVLAQLVESQNLKGQTLNIGTGEEVTMKQLLNNLIIEFGDPVRSVEFLEARPADVPRLWVDNTLMKNLLPNLKLTPFSEGLHEAIVYYKELAVSRNLIAEIEEQNWK